MLKGENITQVDQLDQQPDIQAQRSSSRNRQQKCWKIFSWDIQTKRRSVAEVGVVQYQNLRDVCVVKWKVIIWDPKGDHLASHVVFSPSNIPELTISINGQNSLTMPFFPQDLSSLTIVNLFQCSKYFELSKYRRMEPKRNKFFIECGFSTIDVWSRSEFGGRGCCF